MRPVPGGRCIIGAVRRALLALLVLTLLAGCGRIAQEPFADDEAAEVLEAGTEVVLPDGADAVRVERARGDAFFLSYEGYLVRFDAPAEAVDAWLAEEVRCPAGDAADDEVVPAVAPGEGDPEWWRADQLEVPVRSALCDGGDDGFNVAYAASDDDPVTVLLRLWRG